MDLSLFLKYINISQYKLSKMSGVPQATISDICSFKTPIENVSGYNLLKIAKALGITIEDLLSKDIDNISITDFDVFKSFVCHQLKEMGEQNFIKEIDDSNDVIKYFEGKEYAKCFYLLAMEDYLVAKNNLQKNEKYRNIRNRSLLYPIYPSSVITLDEVNKTNANKKEAYKNSIKEFKNFNLIECEIDNVY